MPIKPRLSLPPPPATLVGMSDAERKIGGGAVFALADVKAHVAEAHINGLNLATQKASDDLNFELSWRLSDVCKFISCLDKCFYRYSEWVYGSDRAKVAYPADVYIMGYNRMKEKEWPQANPWNYFKFSFSSHNNTIEIFSIHLENVKQN